ncbi:helix-turn-helix transcriptional regulator [Actinacidiphila epipremni]|uniref:Helix-turn-helix domain-containing protein n=1 Tax=Actinacidiphila epipremni TaxID=2053013 RepID=A0ABX0ZV27_9ACTN|nr:helix-turn-helix domain-containing protein [Actinacidiphila epipremni]NJP45338.1 helix-turn-helix domain-containing protein [Actinacidiphila epipremni]
MSEQATPRRRAVAEAVRAAGRPVDVTELARRLGVHANTVRFHLDALLAEGAVTRRTEPPSGRGRPRTVYAHVPGMDRSGPRGYLLLARLLVAHLTAQPRTAAEAAGHAWGAQLAAPPAVPSGGPPAEPPGGPSESPAGPGEAARRLADVLAGIGFAPDVESARRIRLRHCPFLELAEENGRVVCSVHLGLMRGALAAMGAPVTAARLEPFATADSCLAHLAPAGAPAEGADPR